MREILIDVDRAQNTEKRGHPAPPVTLSAEIAAELGISESTVVRTWRVARAWLFDCLQPLKRPALAATPL